ncbi:hypothetical protein [Cellulomonas alba]|uniref:Uncharacterized protein n=1 Tax=Cellulomonas alba TaxID=3053467 RepID=A0ABT7SJS8_9CELL|nr:hypothetical protein [Cellulomonas alba]MDM7855809.1 hypothetical protein [Cellulomonas alba]
MLGIDFSRPLRAKERSAFEYRRDRLAGAFGRSVVSAAEALDRFGSLRRGLTLRNEFVCLDAPIDENAASDRRAPRRELRPSATRVSTSQGVALRLYLAGLAIAQMTTPPGHRARLPQLEIASFESERGWTDVIASGAISSGRGATHSSARDKKARSVRAALDTLSEAGLVELPGDPGRRGRHEGFTLLHEAGRQLSGDRRPYVVPRLRESSTFAVPAGFITNGWIHVLEDSEITLLLMVACGLHALRPDPDSDVREGEVAIPAWARLRHYGIHRDPFSAARKTLDWYGLLHVREIDRHDDGRAENEDARLHRLALKPDGFDADALTSVRAAIDAQLAR